jgi:hypothetical protein
MKKFLRKHCPKIIHKAYAETKFWLLCHICPKAVASELFRGIMGYDIDWKNPRDLNEKINWLKFYSDTSEWTRLADKYLAREYISEKLGEDVLPKLYGVWKKAEDIDFTTLPDKFVIKTNHGCGGVVLVKDKSSLDILKVKKTIATSIHEKFGYRTMEPHYLNIKPVIMAEEMIENDADFSTSIADYKVFCINGEPACILICTDRANGHTNLSFYDTEWNALPEVNAGHHAGEFKVIPKPECLDKLLDYSRILSNGFPQIRIDFYISNKKIYVGELTFTSHGGYMDYLSYDFSLKLGMNVPLIHK